MQLLRFHEIFTIMLKRRFLYVRFIYVKFKYFEKATKKCKNLPIFIWRYLVSSKKFGRYFRTVVAFSEYLNFKNTVRFIYFCGLLKIFRPIVAQEGDGCDVSATTTLSSISVVNEVKLWKQLLLFQGKTSLFLKKFLGSL